MINRCPLLVVYLEMFQALDTRSRIRLQGMQTLNYHIDVPVLSQWLRHHGRDAVIAVSQHKTGLVADKPPPKIRKTCG